MGLRRVRAFDDWRSAVHVVAAALAVLADAVSGTCVSLAATIAYTAYQLASSKTLREAAGDMLEWVTGLMIGALLSLLVVVTTTD